MAMEQGVSGSFDIKSNNVGTFAARIFYSEQYDSNTGKHIVNITGISIQSKEYGNWWYPHGKISVDDEVVGTMDNSNPASHRVSLTAGSGWHVVSLYYGSNGFPWVSSEILSDKDGNKTVTISVDFLLYRDSTAPRPSFTCSQEIVLTHVAPKNMITYNDNGKAVKCKVYHNVNGVAVRCNTYYNKNGVAVKV